MLLLVTNPNSKKEKRIVGLKAPNGECDIRWAVRVWVWCYNIWNKENNSGRSQQRAHHSWE